MRWQRKVWDTHTMYKGLYTPIRDLLADGSHVAKIYGNAKEGWYVGLATKTMPNVAIDVSPVYAREFGDTMRDLQAACKRAYGVHPVKHR